MHNSSEARRCSELWRMALLFAAPSSVTGMMQLLGPPFSLDFSYSFIYQLVDVVKNNSVSEIEILL